MAGVQGDEGRMPGAPGQDGALGPRARGEAKELERLGARERAWEGVRAREEREARRKAVEENERQRKEQKARRAGGTREPSAARRREAFHKIERRWVYHDDDEMDADASAMGAGSEGYPLPTLSAFVDNAKPAKGKGAAHEFEIVESLPRVIALDEEDDDGIDDWEEVEVGPEMETQTTMKTGQVLRKAGQRLKYSDALRNTEGG
ncbi:hypothetical protein GLOTRDRAFT_138012 [Gloeophyllum trabeum ATCC 11539]|uniref:Uncharacterized protein n=1 Tax=Gloeophyllum trabeum (strain ATCC 11539 / FP-39264 / Madison 617) TaxID=670483 RepID=S7Q8A7_GLOTA|nr:uncharacterized protein GLOTRDRAFT_138012 [Gloeophyllum trabeum ATCC 11539]EPQ56216.1 hypothetical protein GLOTRDRAFT_138012 [Gloeophyllum trabeum ATCC 11539]